MLSPILQQHAVGSPLRTADRPTLPPSGALYCLVAFLTKCTQCIIPARPMGDLARFSCAGEGASPSLPIHAHKKAPAARHVPLAVSSATLHLGICCSMLCQMRQHIRWSAAHRPRRDTACGQRPLPPLPPCCRFRHHSLSFSQNAAFLTHTRIGSQTTPCRHIPRDTTHGHRNSFRTRRWPGHGFRRHHGRGVHMAVR